MWLALALWGCGTESVACGDGFTLRDDGLCYDATEDPPPTLEDALLALPCHGRVTPGARLDLVRGCVDDRCIGDTYAEFVATWGEADSCERSPYSFDQDELDCDWGDGRTASFAGADPDGDGVSAPGAPASWLSVDSPWKGADPSGIALGVSMGCLVDELGLPWLVFVGERGGELLLLDASWYEPRVSASDWYGGESGFESDGSVDSLSFSD